MHRDDLHLEDFFDYEFMAKALKIYCLTRVNDYPDLVQELKWYKRKLKSTKRVVLSIPRSFIFRETNTQKIIIDDNNFYSVTWSIPLAQKVINKYERPLEKFSLKELIQVVDRDSITESHLGFALHNNTPIIIADYPAMVTEKKFLVIDGNHRVTSKYDNGQKEILGYMLEPYQHLQAMFRRKHRRLYKVHHNYYLIASYIGGLINEKELEESLFQL